MEFVKLLRDLWRMRLSLALALVLAILVTIFAAYKISPGGIASRQHYVGIASARVLVDTPSSQVIDLGLKEDANAGVLPARAVLLANLLTTSPLRDDIAKRAGVRADRLIALADTPTDSGPPVSAPLTTGASVKLGDPRANVVKLHTDVSLPLITVNTEAPDAATAARLANSTVAVLTDYLQSLVAGGQVPKDRQVVLKRLGAASAAVEQRGPSRIIALTLGLVFFLFACGTILLISALAREWRKTAPPDDAAAQAPEEPAPGRAVALERRDQDEAGFAWMETRSSQRR